MSDDPHYWANVLIAGTNQDEAALVMEAINDLTATRRAKTGAVLIVCAQILAQQIVRAPPLVKTEIRQGIISLIDDYIMRIAVHADE